MQSKTQADRCRRGCSWPAQGLRLALCGSLASVACTASWHMAFTEAGCSTRLLRRTGILQQPTGLGRLTEAEGLGEKRRLWVAHAGRCGGSGMRGHAIISAERSLMIGGSDVGETEVWREGWAGAGAALRRMGALLMIGLLCVGVGGLRAGAMDELAQYAKDGNKVGVDAKCFVERCSLQTHSCLNNPDCIKGLSCLSKCKGEGTCSTACFAKYGSKTLDDMLYCAVEKQDCVHVPRDKSRATWNDADEAGASKKPVSSFEIASLQGRWYKVMGMDARYDCFDCQLNRFEPKAGEAQVMKAEVQFRMPRPRAPGFWENRVTEELIGDGPGARRSMHSVGRMFGLTFWENWYIIGENEPGSKLPPFKFVYYTGHTLQGNYEGAFVYARTPELPSELMPAVDKVARASGLDINKFCKIRNTCFTRQPEPLLRAESTKALRPTSPALKGPVALLWSQSRNWAVQMTSLVNQELTDWFEDPSKTSDWLLSQQEKVVWMDASVTQQAQNEKPPPLLDLIAKKDSKR